MVCIYTKELIVITTITYWIINVDKHNDSVLYVAQRMKPNSSREYRKMQNPSREYRFIVNKFNMFTFSFDLQFGAWIFFLIKFDINARITHSTCYPYIKELYTNFTRTILQKNSRTNLILNPRYTEEAFIT